MRRITSILLAGILAGGCASVPPGAGVDYDPWEKTNRSLYRINEVIDKATLKPVAKGYSKVIPEPVRNSVTNFSQNLLTPGSAINNFLQGKPRDGVSEIFRFLINSTAGIGGLFEIAARNGLDPQTEDFGQTAAVWGVPAGPYVMLPFLGPQTLRDAVLIPLNVMADPLYHYDNSSVRDRVYVLRLINLRARLLNVEDLLRDSNDPYVTVRESYLQNRLFNIYDGNPPVEEEDDDLFEEFLEEDY
jgi:phospholipid-binding lipoprotein MlaA